MGVGVDVDGHAVNVKRTKMVVINIRNRFIYLYLPLWRDISPLHKRPGTGSIATDVSDEEGARAAVSPERCPDLLQQNRPGEKRA